MQKVSEGVWCTSSDGGKFTVTKVKTKGGFVDFSGEDRSGTIYYTVTVTSTGKELGGKFGAWEGWAYISGRQNMINKVRAFMRGDRDLSEYCFEAYHKAYLSDHHKGSIAKFSQAWENGHEDQAIEIKKFLSCDEVVYTQVTVRNNK